MCVCCQDLTQHINVGGEQHSQSLKQLLQKMNTIPDAQKELSRWGLQVTTDILMVRNDVAFHLSMYFLASSAFAVIGQTEDATGEWWDRESGYGWEMTRVTLKPESPGVWYGCLTQCVTRYTLGVPLGLWLLISKRYVFAVHLVIYLQLRCVSLAFSRWLLCKTWLILN